MVGDKSRCLHDSRWSPDQLDWKLNPGNFLQKLLYLQKILIFWFLTSVILDVQVFKTTLVIPSKLSSGFFQFHSNWYMWKDTHGHWRARCQCWVLLCFNCWLQNIQRPSMPILSKRLIIRCCHWIYCFPQNLPVEIFFSFPCHHVHVNFRQCVFPRLHWAAATVCIHWGLHIKQVISKPAVNSEGKSSI